MTQEVPVQTNSDNATTKVEPKVPPKCHNPRPGEGDDPVAYLSNN
jgi:hypothetical protein